MNDAAKELVSSVMGELAEEGFFSTERFVDSSVQEVNQALQEMGVLGNIRLFALCKFREDFETTYQNLLELHGKGELAKLAPLERFRMSAPPYLNHLLDEEYARELIEVWIEQMLEGTIPVPQKLPVLLNNIIRKTDPDWAEYQMDKDDPNLNVLARQEHFNEALYRAGLC